MTPTQNYVIRTLNQGSQEWLDWRRWAVTASDVAAIAGLSPWANSEEILQQKLAGTQPETNYAMQRGSNLEPIARRHFETKKGKAFPAVCVEHSEQNWMRASLDGLSHDGEILELKAPNWKVHESALLGFVPDYYMAQLQWQLLVTGLDVAWFVTITQSKKFGAGDELAIVRVGPDAELQSRLLECAEEFYGRLMQLKGRSTMEGK